jgi:two-component system, NarL family, sensor kinase
MSGECANAGSGSSCCQNPVVGVRTQRKIRGVGGVAWLMSAASVVLLIGYVPLRAFAAMYATTLAGAPNEAVDYAIAMTPITIVEDVFLHTAYVAFSVLGALIVSRHAENRVGWVFCIVGLLGGLTEFAGYYAIHTLLVSPGSLPAGLAAAWLNNWLWIPYWGTLGIFLPLMFPTGRALSPRWRPATWFGAGATALLSFYGMFHSGPLWNQLEALAIDNPLGITALGDVTGTDLQVAMLVVGPLLFSMLVAGASLLLRLRRARGRERLQVKWFAFTAALLVLVFIAQLLVPAVLTGSGSELQEVYPLLLALTFASLPIATGTAILRYRLYDIDVIINRALVYGTLTAGVIGLYTVVVGVMGTLFQTGGNLLASLVATGVVAVLFQPLRERLQRSVNRLLYGQRDEPYTVLSRLSRRLEETLPTDAVLPLIVETLARALKLPYAAIALEPSSGLEVAAAYGNSPGEVVRLPLVYQADTVGQLLLARRAPDESFSPADRRLVEDLARQVGVAVHAARLTVDLQRSRERLVTAREEERRRLRRDLHDGLGPVLAAQTLKVGSARALYSRTPAAADALLGELETDLGTALVDIRRLVYELRPPALDELGLIGAIREEAARSGAQDTRRTAQAVGLGVTIEAPERLPALSAAVEVAAYRIVQEALTNMLRHAHARTGRVRFSLDGAFQVEITDDGVGLPSPRHVGIGLLSMRERAEELGGTCIVERNPAGGTRVLARLPLEAPENRLVASAH